MRVLLRARPLLGLGTLVKFDKCVSAHEFNVGISVQAERNHTPDTGARMRELDDVGSDFGLGAGQLGLANPTAIRRRHDDGPIRFADHVHEPDNGLITTLGVTGTYGGTTGPGTRGC